MKIYVIQGGQFCKVGTARDVKRRLRGIQNGNPLPLKIVYEQEVPDLAAFDLESQVHSLLEGRCERAMGEWFKTNWEHAVATVQEVCKHLEQDGTNLGTTATTDYRTAMGLSH